MCNVSTYSQIKVVYQPMSNEQSSFRSFYLFFILDFLSERSQSCPIMINLYRLNHQNLSKKIHHILLAKNRDFPGGTIYLSKGKFLLLIENLESFQWQRTL